VVHRVHRRPDRHCQAGWRHQGVPVPTGRAGPYDIVSGPDGNLWFTEFAANKIGRMTPAGGFAEYPLPNDPAAPTDHRRAGQVDLVRRAARQPDGRLTIDGHLTEFAIPYVAPFVPKPYGVVAGPDGNIWFTEEGSARSAGSRRPAC